MEICAVGAELFYEDRRTDGKTDRKTEERTDMIRLLVALCDFDIAPKMYPWTLCEIIRRRKFGAVERI